MNIDHDALMSFDFFCRKETGKNRKRCKETVRKSYMEWSNIRTFSDLMRISRDVSLGKLYSPIYADLLTSDSSDNAHMHMYTNAFAELQMHGFVTMNSQFEKFDDHDIQKAYITGFMPLKMAEYVCGMANRRPDMVAYMRHVHFHPPREFAVESTLLGVTFEEDSVIPFTRMNLVARPQSGFERWCPQINHIILEAQLVNVELINVNYHAPLGTLLAFTLDVVKTAFNNFNKS